MPLTIEDLKKLPTLFDEYRGKSLPEVVEMVIYRAYKELTGREVTVFSREVDATTSDDHQRKAQSSRTPLKKNK